MSRDLPPDLTAAIEAPVVRPFLAVRIELPDPVYAFTGRGILNFDDADGNNHDWIGAGEVAAIDTIGEATDGSATGIKVALNEVPADFQLLDGTWMVDYLDVQVVRGALFEVYVGALNETFQTVDAVVLLQKYRLDTYTITDGGATLSVEVTGESRAIDQRRPAIKRFTDEWQQRKHPGDIFLQYVPQMTEIPILWAQAELGGGGALQVGGGAGGGGSAGTPTFRV